MAVFYEERFNDTPGAQHQGNVRWSVVEEAPADGQPPEPAVRAIVQIPDSGVTMTMTIRRNADATLPASHVIEMMFDVPENFPGGEIANVQRLAFKPTEQDRGRPLIGVAGKISDGFFWIALNDLQQAVQDNLSLMALIIAVGKITISMLSAFAVVFFRFPFRMTCFWLIFITLMLPVEVRLIPTFQVMVNLHLTDTMTGLTLPLIASATATLLFRQFFLTIPDELAEAARLDGAGPLRFLRDVVLPLSRNSIAALFVILFIYGWNQYLWPLLVTTQPDYYTVVMGIQRIARAVDSEPVWNLVMGVAVMAMLPPVIVVVAMQKLFVRGLTETEK